MLRPSPLVLEHGMNPSHRILATAALSASLALALPSVAPAQTTPYGTGTVTMGVAQLSPSATTYTYGTDFGLFSYSAFFGTSPFALAVTARLFDIGTIGCDAASFAGFVVGSIALIDRGICLFSVSYQNAQAAGASGVLFVNHLAGTPPDIGGFPDPNVPVFMLEQSVGSDLRALIGRGQTPTMELSYEFVPTIVPEPATLVLTAGGLLLLAAMGRRRRAGRSEAGV
jgi:hypothetical protein